MVDQDNRQQLQDVDMPLAGYPHSVTRTCLRSPGLPGGAYPKPMQLKAEDFPNGTAFELQAASSFLRQPTSPSVAGSQHLTQVPFASRQEAKGSHSASSWLQSWFG
jgi:hypothetical protein